MQQEVVMGVRDYVKMLRERVSHITGQPLGGVGLDGKYATSGENGTLSPGPPKNPQMEQEDGKSGTVGLGLRVERLAEELRERTRLKALKIEAGKSGGVGGIGKMGKRERLPGERLPGEQLPEERPPEERQGETLESVWDHHFSNGAHRVVGDPASRDQKGGQSRGAGVEVDLRDEVEHGTQVGEEVKPESPRHRMPAQMREENLEPNPNNGAPSNDVGTEQPRGLTETDPEKTAVDAAEAGQQENEQMQHHSRGRSPGSPRSPVDSELLIPKMAQELGHRVFAAHLPSASDRAVAKEHSDLSNKPERPGEQASMVEAELQSGDRENSEGAGNMELPPKATDYSNERLGPGNLPGRHHDLAPGSPAGMRPGEDEIKVSIPEAESVENALDQEEIGKRAQHGEQALEYPGAPSKSSDSPDRQSRPAQILERSFQEGAGDQSRLEDHKEQIQAETQEFTQKRAQHIEKSPLSKKMNEELAQDESRRETQDDHDAQGTTDAHVRESVYGKGDRAPLDAITRNGHSTFVGEELDVAGRADEDKRREDERHPQELEVFDTEQGGNVDLGVVTTRDASVTQQIIYEPEAESKVTEDIQAIGLLRGTHKEGQHEMSYFNEQPGGELLAVEDQEDEQHPDVAKGSPTEAHFKGEAQVGLERDRGDGHVLRDEQDHADTAPTSAAPSKGLVELERHKRQKMRTDLEDFAEKISFDDPVREETEFTSVLDRHAVTGDTKESRTEVTRDLQSSLKLEALHEEEDSQTSEDAEQQEATTPQAQKVSTSELGKGTDDNEHRQDDERLAEWLRTLQHGSVAAPHLVEPKDQKEEENGHEAIPSKGAELTDGDGKGVVKPKKVSESVPGRQSEASSELVQEILRSESPQGRLSQLLQLSGGVPGPDEAEIPEVDLMYERAAQAHYEGSGSEENFPEESLVRNEKPKKRLKGHWHRSAQAREREDPVAGHHSEEGSSRGLFGRLPRFLRDKGEESGEVIAREREAHARRRPHFPHLSRLAHNLRRPADKKSKEDAERTREAVAGNAVASDIGGQKESTEEKDERGVTFGFRERFRRIRQMMALSSSSSSDHESDKDDDDSETLGRRQRLLKKVREVRRSKDGTHGSVSSDEELEAKEDFDLEKRVDMGGVGGREEEIGIGEEVTGARRVNDGCVSFIVPQGWTARRLEEGFALSKERALGFVWAVDASAVHHVLLQTERLALPSTVNVAASPVFLSENVICVDYHCHYYAARAIARFEGSGSKGATFVSLAIPAKDGGQKVLAKMENVLMRSICLIQDAPRIRVDGNHQPKIEQVHSASYIDNTRCTVQ